MQMGAYSQCSCNLLGRIQCCTRFTARFSSPAREVGWPEDVANAKNAETASEMCVRTILRV